MTRFCDRFHTEMMEFREQYLQTNDEDKKLQIYMKMNTYTTILSVPNRNRKSLINPIATLPSGAPDDTSDDTRELELRPKK
ncbi:unnamed protein product [Rhizophagus irregularis]|nr:unnamed protein product [Rhizophagus irregularis]